MKPWMKKKIQTYLYGIEVVQSLILMKSNNFQSDTQLSWFNLVNIIDADVLAPYVVRTSAAMILTM